jgi:vacuolar-type H+-ATPase subunit I/STV1
MSIRRLSQLQWLGILAGGIVWFVEFLAATGESQAQCNPSSGRWGLPHDAIELALMIFGALVVGGALAASLIVYRETRDVDDQDAPPEGRIHFFATAAVAGNVIFLVIILLTGIATIVDRTCHQA